MTHFGVRLLAAILLAAFVLPLAPLVKERKGGVYAPKSIEVVASLPLTAVGKADKKALRARYWGDRPRAVN